MTTVSDRASCDACLRSDPDGVRCTECRDGLVGLDKRQCFIVLVDQRDEHGFIPSLVTWDEPGHAPLVGSGACSTPWYWGTTFEQAQHVCDDENRRTFGLTPDEALAIKASSISAQLREGRRA